MGSQSTVLDGLFGVAEGATYYKIYILGVRSSRSNAPPPTAPNDPPSLVSACSKYESRRVRSSIEPNTAAAVWPRRTNTAIIEKTGQS